MEFHSYRILSDFQSILILCPVKLLSFHNLCKIPEINRKFVARRPTKHLLHIVVADVEPKVGENLLKL